jgi:hypothetical protein
MNDQEQATIPEGSPRRGTFPREWGRPPEDEEQRTGWIKAKIRCGQIARNFGEEVRWLGHSTHGRVTVPSRVIAQRIARMRLQLLDHLARGPW